VPGVFEQPVLYFLAHWPTAVRVGALGEGRRALDQAVTAVDEEPEPHEHGALPVSALENLVRCHANIDAEGTTELRRELLSTRSLAGWESTPAWPAFILARVHLLVDEGHPDMAEAELRRYEHTATGPAVLGRSEEHTSELQSRFDLVCRLLLEKKHQLAQDLAVRRQVALRLEQRRRRRVGGGLSVLHVRHGDQANFEALFRLI